MNEGRNQGSKDASKSGGRKKDALPVNTSI